MRRPSNSIMCELLARHALEIAGVVDRSEGVLVAADPKHGLENSPADACWCP